MITEENPQPKKKKTLAQLMDSLYQAEEGITELSEEETKELFMDIKDKVDDMKGFIDTCKNISARLHDRIEKLKSEKQRIDNKIVGVKYIAALNMKNSDTPELYGTEWTMQLRNKKSVKAKDIDLTSDIYLDLNEGQNKPVVKRKYSWDARELESAYKRNPEKFKDYVDEVVTYYPQFSIKKEVK